jgi:hypothetical protein
LKAKKCKVCSNEYVPNKPLQIVCGLKCAVSYSKAKLAEREAKESKKRQSERKEAIKKKSDYLNEAKKAFQHWIRLRDYDQLCISCGSKESNQWAGGHYFSAYPFTGLIFEETNCHKQCNSHCNKFLSGNVTEYRKGLIQRYGIEYVENLERLSETQRTKAWSKEELIEMKKKYIKKIAEAKK